MVILIVIFMCYYHDLAQYVWRWECNIQPMNSSASVMHCQDGFGSYWKEQLFYIWLWFLENICLMYKTENIFKCISYFLAIFPCSMFLIRVLICSKKVWGIGLLWPRAGWSTSSNPVYRNQGFFKRMIYRSRSLIYM